MQNKQLRKELQGMYVTGGQMGEHQRKFVEIGKTQWKYRADNGQYSSLPQRRGYRAGNVGTG